MGGGTRTPVFGFGDRQISRYLTPMRIWLGGLDSNKRYLVQSQVAYQLADLRILVPGERVERSWAASKTTILPVR